jgi:hypothetical protein
MFIICSMQARAARACGNSSRSRNRGAGAGAGAAVAWRVNRGNRYNDRPSHSVNVTVTRFEYISTAEAAKKPI